jgi:hypothetical protein
LLTLMLRFIILIHSQDQINLAHHTGTPFRTFGVTLSPHQAA